MRSSTVIREQDERVLPLATVDLGGVGAMAVRRLAQLVATTRPGDRLPSVSELRRQLGVGTGTISAAMRELQRSGAVQLDSRQHRGSFVVGRDLGTLWGMMGQPPLVGVLPLPGSLEFEGLASGLRAEFTRLGVPLALIYAHGSNQRYEMVVTQRVDFAVMSSPAGDFLCNSASPSQRLAEIVTTLGPGSYYSKDSVAVIATVGKDQLPAHPRVGIDRASYDHTALTQLEFPGGALVEVTYGQLPAALRVGVVDVGVWHGTRLAITAEDSRPITWPLTKPAAQSLLLELSHAVVVVRRSNALAHAVLANVDIEKVEQSQLQVVTKQALPFY